MSLTIQAVICTVDFSFSSPLVIGYGVAMARRLGVRLYLFHAIHNPQDGVHSTAVFERGGDLTHFSETARRQMGELMADFHEDWEAVVRFGDPVEETVAFSNSFSSSVVVAASHGVSGLKRLFIGTVVERLSRALTCPILVVKPGFKKEDKRFDGFASVVVSSDEKGYWHRLAPLLVSFQADRLLRIHLVHTIESPMDIVELDEETAPYTEAQQKLQVRMEGVLRNQGLRFFPMAETLSVEVAPGVPQEMILNAAVDLKSDLVVVGVRHSGKFGRLISGSTTEALLRRSPCDVLVFPEPVAADHKEDDR